MMVQTRWFMMMIIFAKIWCWSFVPVFAQSISKREIENPYLAAEVGDWLLMERITPLPSGPEKSLERRTIKSKDASKIVIQYTSVKANGEEDDFYVQTIDLSRPFTTLTLLGYPEPGIPIRIVGEGDEVVSVDGNRLNTSWITYSLEAPGWPKSKKKVWRSNDVPVGGLVKQVQTTSSGGPSSLTLLEFGYADPAKNKKRASMTDAQETPAEQWVNSIGMQLQHIPSGAFTMGALPKREFLRKAMGVSREQRLELLMRSPPQSSALIERDFSVGIHEVTIGQFRKFVEATAYKTDAEKDGRGGTGLNADRTWGQDADFTWQNYGFDISEEHAVANVSWNDAQAFCKWLSQKEGQAYRLLSEAEWEYCCRAETHSTYFSGEVPTTLKGHANLADASLAAATPGLPWALGHDDGHPYSAPVGKFKANDFGLHDMHGNVLEWCSSEFSAFDPLPEAAGPKPPGTRYVLRGGHWFGEPWRAGSACRSGAEPTHRMSLIGFRVATDALINQN